MIGLISDDRFFLAGALAALGNSGRNAKAIDTDLVNNLEALPFGKGDVIIFSSDNAELIKRILLYSSERKIKVIFMVDDIINNTGSSCYAYGVISKKAHLLNFVKSIDAIAIDAIDNNCLLYTLRRRRWCITSYGTR